MKNNIVKMVMVVFIFVVIGSALNSMSASLITQSKNGSVDLEAVANAGISSVKDDLAIGESISIDYEDAQNFVDSAKDGYNNLVDNCSENASSMIDLDAILMTGSN